MYRLTSIFLLLSIFQTITSQGGPPPPHCRGPPPGVDNPTSCCKFPPIFKEEDFAECGIERPGNRDGPPRGPPDCSKQICLLKKYNLLKDESSVDKEAVTAFIDKWGADNPDFKDAVEIAKEKCLKDDLPGPPQICQPSKIVFCISLTMFANCPKWEDSENCQKVKQHIDDCKQYMP